MSTGAFVYTEVPISIPFEQAPWRELNPVLRSQPGFRNKTWLSGLKNNSVGGLYEFDSLENARRFVIDYFPTESAKLGVPHTAHLYDLPVVEEASRGLNSLHFGGTWKQPPAAFVWDDVQISVPFAQSGWRELNEILRVQPGLMHKTWLAGINTNTAGGFYAFDTVENAVRFATVFFPQAGKKLNAGYAVRVFDGRRTAEASKAMNSPFFK